MNFPIDQMTVASDQASALLKSLGHRHRLLMLCLLVERERSVGELAATLGLRESSASQHLSLLRRDGVVARRREGQTIWYSIASEPARRVLEAIHGYYCTNDPSAPQPR
jgi:DNA-binding transcriptional ArsR family regulator